MSNIRFRSAAHRDFFLEMMNKSRVNDCYHRAFFYVMGIAGETRKNINQMFDFKTDCIIPEGMHGLSLIHIFGRMMWRNILRICRINRNQKRLLR